MSETVGAEFEEISHTGGRATFTIRTDPDGRRSYQVGWSHSAPRPATLFAVYAIPQGYAVGSIQMGGIGTPWNKPPIPGCFPVMLASDSEGMFGHECPLCRGYWRSRGGASYCPYCGLKAQRHDFLTKAQRRYVAHYCSTLVAALEAPEDGVHTIDMDEVRALHITKPPFYYSAERQQTPRSCPKCQTSDDILGRYGYCSGCGLRSDLAEFEADIKRIREQINSDADRGDCVRGAVALFDAYASRYMKQLVRRVPLTQRRSERLEAMRFHDLKRVAAEFETVFDIAIWAGVAESDVSFAVRMFYRRHVYEHEGGIVDEKYLADSGDTSVRLGQMITEDQETSHRLASVLVKFARNIHNGFQALFPPEEHEGD